MIRKIEVHLSWDTDEREYSASYREGSGKWIDLPPRKTVRGIKLLVQRTVKSLCGTGDIIISTLKWFVIRLGDEEKAKINEVDNNQS